MNSDGAAKAEPPERVRLDHQPERSIEDAARGIEIGILHHLHGGPDVGETARSPSCARRQAVPNPMEFR